MTIEVTSLHPLFMARVDGIDLTQPVTPGAFEEIAAAFDRHAVLLFRDQHITDAEQVAFSAHFGGVFTATNYHRKGQKSRLRAEMADISNLDHDGELMAADDTRRAFNEANRLWHTDNSFKQVPSRCSLLSAREIPPSGGETEFADMRAAYDALPKARKREIDELIVEHSIMHSRARLGYTDFSEGARNELPPVRQVLVRTHPGTGRKALFIASHASHVVGWPEEKGRRLIEELLDFATQPQFVHRHEWRVGDLVVWDNRCTMHRARPYDDMNQRRDLRRTTVSDDINTVERRAAEA